MMLPRDKLLDLAFMIVASEEAGGVRVVSVPTEVVTRGAVSEPYIATGRSVEIPATIAEIEGDGVVEEVNIISTSSNYRITIRSGGKTVIDTSFDELYSISQYVNWVSAVVDEERGKYVLTLYNIPFSGGAVISLSPINVRRSKIDYYMVKALIMK